MADQIDIAQEREQTDTARAINAARRAPSGPAAEGRCLHCDMPLDEGRRWCDAACRDDWQRENPGQ